MTASKCFVNSGDFSRLSFISLAIIAGDFFRCLAITMAIFEENSPNCGRGGISNKTSAKGGCASGAKEPYCGSIHFLISCFKMFDKLKFSIYIAIFLILQLFCILVK